MKKKLTLLLTIVLAATMLCSCSNSKEKEAAKSTVESFMEVLKSGDFTDATKYCDKEVQENMGLTDLQNLGKAFYQSLGLSKKDLSKKASKSVSSFVKKIRTDFITEYDIKGVELEDDNKATVNVKVTYGYDPNGLADIDISSKLSKISSKYVSKNKESLTSLYVDKGEKALQKKVYSAILPDALTAYSKAIKKLGSSTQEVQYELEKKDDTWIIVGAYSTATSESDKSSEKTDSSNSDDSSSSDKSSKSSKSSDDQ